MGQFLKFIHRKAESTTDKLVRALFSPPVWTADQMQSALKQIRISKCLFLFKGYVCIAIMVSQVDVLGWLQTT